MANPQSLDALCLDALCCPITTEPFEEPVILAGDGHTYERGAIEDWLASHTASPLTGADLTTPESRLLIANHAVRKMIDELSASKPPPPPPRRPPPPLVPARRPPPPLPPRDVYLSPRSFVGDAELALKIARDDARLEDASRAARAALCALDAQKARELALEGA